jgi:Kef-type K+ transport system membrane component KefB
LEHGTEALTRLILQLAVILFAAKISGEICERFLRTPAVIGELLAGVIIGPFALGGMIPIPGIGPLFGTPVSAGDHVEEAGSALSQSLVSISEVGAIVLLFVAGLETNLRQFLRYAGPASVVAVGGVALPFALGVIATIAFGFAEGPTDPRALFIGATMTATSIGISVRVLGDLRKLGTPEGVTILGAAVLDDVLGILILTIVVGIGTTGEFSLGTMARIAFTTLGFWVALTGIGILLSRHISNIIDKFQVSGASVGLSLALAFFAAAISETAGLAMIIGAFSIGLALSGTELAHRLEGPLQSVYALLVPIFFVVTGMMVDVTALGGVIVFGLVLTLLAALGKILGSGVPTVFAGFNRRGAWRIGVGMMPRGEVALIMAGIGVSSGIIGPDLFGVAIIMTILTTILAPLILSRSFADNVSGARPRQAQRADPQSQPGSDGQGD